MQKAGNETGGRLLQITSTADRAYNWIQNESTEISHHVEKPTAAECDIFIIENHRTSISFA